jgi:hypothetical protein
MADDKREAMFAGAAQRLSARSVGQPEDIANAVLFLATTVLRDRLDRDVIWRGRAPSSKRCLGERRLKEKPRRSGA